MRSTARLRRTATSHSKQLGEGDAPHIGEVLLRFDTLWQQALEAERPFFRPSALTPERHATLGHEILRAYLQGNRETPAPLAAELAFEIMVGDQTLRGVIDRIDEAPEGLIIVDFKSGQRKLSPQEVERDLQLTVYAFAAEQLYGKSVAQVAQYYLRDGTYIPARRGADDFASLTGEILPYAMRVVHDGQYPARIGYWCNWCDFRELCRAERAHASEREHGAVAVGGERTPRAW